VEYVLGIVTELAVAGRVEEEKFGLSLERRVGGGTEARRGGAECCGEGRLNAQGSLRGSGRCGLVRFELRWSEAAQLRGKASKRTRVTKEVFPAPLVPMITKVGKLPLSRLRYNVRCKRTGSKRATATEKRIMVKFGCIMAERSWGMEESSMVIVEELINLHKSCTVEPPSNSYQHDSNEGRRNECGLPGLHLLALTKTEINPLGLEHAKSAPPRQNGVLPDPEASRFSALPYSPAAFCSGIASWRKDENTAQNLSS
jgi:hypothetical protein